MIALRHTLLRSSMAFCIAAPLFALLLSGCGSVAKDARVLSLPEKVAMNASLEISEKEGREEVFLSLLLWEQEENLDIAIENLEGIVSNIRLEGKAGKVIAEGGELTDFVALGGKAEGEAHFGKGAWYKVPLSVKDKKAFEIGNLSKLLAEGEILLMMNTLQTTTFPAKIVAPISAVVLPQPHTSPSLRYSGFVKPLSEGATFYFVAQRLRENEDEYLPNSEQIRVHISAGKQKYQSEQGMAFMQMIYAVRPEEVGKGDFYSIEWSGADDAGKHIKSNVYEAELTLTAAPQPYTMRLVFPTQK